MGTRCSQLLGWNEWSNVPVGPTVIVNALSGFGRWTVAYLMTLIFYLYRTPRKIFRAVYHDIRCATTELSVLTYWLNKNSPSYGMKCLKTFSTKFPHFFATSYKFCPPPRGPYNTVQSVLTRTNKHAHVWQRVQVKEWLNEFDEMDRQSSGWAQRVQSRIDELYRNYGPRVVGKRRCTIQHTHYVANLAVLPLYGTLPDTCRNNCTR